jgi:hypothetical protein
VFEPPRRNLFPAHLSVPPKPPTDTSCFPLTSPSSCPRVAFCPRYVSQSLYWLETGAGPYTPAIPTLCRCRNRALA